ncbi:Zn-dependent oxidoreductase, NADPH:quinone reductase [Galbibacter orientalis DSM 19592]|uniref:Zn-dependent oxidoreductase, NADPH:quinone reductase n=1 Tax=Galbibacter orientalis DSM 19592 TaxID=926559 RepID=I3C1T3_9FLAO|nr:NADP-dependent oxidoreductase [Galbibacter orientalis]EIJ37576.1 Zn-dependent oxidoreductase, NADPH:quinone reductase [Galbibacter orientalis DSM 19592]
MRAIILSKNGNLNQLTYTELSLPSLNEGEVLVQTKAIGINPIDLKTKNSKGIYSKLQGENPLILGWELSGVVTQSRSEKFAEGEEVFGLINFPGHGRTYAEYVACPATDLAKKPSNCSHFEAAGTSLAALTAYQSLVHLGGLKSEQKILIHAASGGVGHFAVQIAKHLGAYVAGTSSEKNKEFVLGLGADKHLDYKTDELEKEHKDYDIVLDTIGGNTIDRSIPLLKKGGILISIPSGKNDAVEEKADQNGIKGLKFTVQSDENDMNVIASFLQQEILKPHISKIVEFDAMEDAHAQIASGHTVGKVIVRL